jgi:ribokinase
LGSGDRRFDALVGVGGIGSGTFFALDGEATLGREESRSGRVLNRRDYCKLHIVSHYVRALLGGAFAVVPVGLVGDDAIGGRLREEMAAAGLDLRYVETTGEAPTMFSFCLVYPDGSGGNLTTSDSAAARLDPARVARVEPELRAHGARGIALALPEVALDTRKALIRLATACGSFRVASFTSREIPDAIGSGVLRDVDLVALNRDEAAVIAPTLPAAVERMRAQNPRILVSVTAGRDGSWSWDGDELRHLPAPGVPVESTSGAGDAHLAGIIAGLAGGLDLASAHELGGLVAAMSVTSPHSIDERIEPRTLVRFTEDRSITLRERVRAFLLAPPVTS